VSGRGGIGRGVLGSRIFGSQGQRATAVLGDDDGVLDAHAAVFGEVDPGLHGDDVAGGERSIALRPDPRPLVDVEADAVTGRVEEGSPPAVAIDDLTADLVELGGADAGLHRVDARLLCLAYDVEHAPLLGRGRADHDGARHVRAVAVHQGAEVEHNEVAFADL